MPIFIVPSSPITSKRKILKESPPCGKAAKLLFAVTLVLLALGYSFCHAMASYDHNENMYVTAGVLISTWPVDLS